ncbi:hypothetical protein GCM10009801_05400 [Streptomyces albiaxialis]|uniref:Chaplin domain-containing protein n=1 Tax=Streptomyces albiaxialis TaxID=329523 RepID=A0ABP5H7Y2_9ACTN
MRIRTGIVSAAVVTAAIFSSAGAALAADTPEDVVKHRPVSVVDDGPTGIGVNLLCGIGILGKGSCSN